MPLTEFMITCESITVKLAPALGILDTHTYVVL